MTTDTIVDFEKKFIAKTLYRLGGRKITEMFVEAKALGACEEMFSDPTCKAMWIAAEQLFSEPSFENTNITKVVIRARQVAKNAKDPDMKTAHPDKEFLDQAESLVRGDDSLVEYFNLLKSALIARNARQIFMDTDVALTSGEDAETVISKASSELSNLLKVGTNERNVVNIRSYMDDILGKYRDAFYHRQILGERSYAPGLGIPWTALRDALGGFGNVLTVVAARPGVGKTSLAVSMMRYWMDNGLKVVFDSLDMEGHEYLMRQIAEDSGISSFQMKYGKTNLEYWDETYKKICTSSENIIRREEEGLYKLLEEPDIDILKSKVKILKDQGMIDVLVVDYIQLMNFRGSSRMSSTQAIELITKKLQSIANQIKIPVLALSQLNRDNEKEGNEPQLVNLKGSGEIEQAAANIILLHPNRELKKKWGDENPPLQYLKNKNRPNALKPLMPMWVIVAKARDGQPDTKIPFVVVQNKYAWYQGDVDASGEEQFNRVCSSWKNLELESIWKENGALIMTEEKDDIEDYNENLRRRELGLPSLEEARKKAKDEWSIKYGEQQKKQEITVEEKSQNEDVYEDEPEHIEQEEEFPF